MRIRIGRSAAVSSSTSRRQKECRIVPMLNIIFTLDYEIEANGDGDPYDLMIEPTDRLLQLFDKYGAKLTIMADAAEILRFREYAHKGSRDDFHYRKLSDQLRRAIGGGHDVQLHLHPSWFNARHERGRWWQDWSEYNFAALPFERANEMVRLGKTFLEELLKPVDRSYACTVFRAANWAVSPATNVIPALLNNGIRIDSSVFKHGRRDDVVCFDYSNAPSNLIPWRVGENDVCEVNHEGKLVEAPIYSERRWPCAFLTFNRIYRVLTDRDPGISKHRDNTGVFASLSQKKILLRKFLTLFRRHAWKADFNQCTGRQLIRALERAAAHHDPEGRARLPFVLIGHSKLFTKANERSLKSFLNFISKNPALFQFATFKSLDGFNISEIGKQRLPC